MPPDLFEAFARDFRILDDLVGPVEFKLGPVEAWQLMGLLQLALAHPANTGAAAETGRKLALQLQAHLAVTPALQAVAERGWHRAGKDAPSPLDDAA